MEISSNQQGHRLHPHSCVLCKQRKVKCDRLDPVCSNCIKADVNCIYKAPDPPRRRKRKASETDLHARLQYYEEILEKQGISVDGSLHGETPLTSTKEPAQLEASSNRRSHLSRITDEGQGGEHGLPESRSKPQRSYRGSDVWNDLHQELHPRSQQVRSWLEEEEESDVESEQDAVGPRFQQRRDADFLLGSPSSTDLRDLVPSSEDVQKLWLIYQTNVDPVVKLIHVPSMGDLIAKGISQLESLSKSEVALFTSVLAAAANTLNDSQCRETFNQSRSSLLETLRAAARQALGSANFLGTSSFTVLQAFTIFLVSVRREYDHPSLWSLTGIAVRIGVRIGLEGKQTKRKTSLFEKEMKRRLWLQLVIYDAQVGELAGSAPHWTNLVEGLNPPSNLNDEDIHPGMTELPPEREGATEVMFSRMRYDLITTMKRMRLLAPGEAPKYSKELQEIQGQAIKEMEDVFVNKFLRHCDPLVPLHNLVALSGRAMVCRIKLLAGHPRQYADRGATLPPSELDRLLDLSLKVIEYQHMGNTDKALQRFHWYISEHVQYAAVVFVLGELKKRSSDPLVERAWNVVENLYDHHPELINDGHRKFYWALGSLVLGVWQHRETEYERIHGRAVETPEFVTRLRSQRDKISGGNRTKESAMDSNSDVYTAPPSVQQTPFSDSQQSGYGTFDFFPPGLDTSWPPGFATNFDPTGQAPYYWSEWDEMLRDFDR